MKEKTTTNIDIETEEKKNKAMGVEPKGEKKTRRKSTTMSKADALKELEQLKSKQDAEQMFTVEMARSFNNGVFSSAEVVTGLPMMLAYENVNANGTHDNLTQQALIDLMASNQKVVKYFALGMFALSNAVIVATAIRVKKHETHNEIHKKNIENEFGEPEIIAKERNEDTI